LYLTLGRPSIYLAFFINSYPDRLNLLDNFQMCLGRPGWRFRTTFLRTPQPC
jgi:hypothetical protein